MADIMTKEQRSHRMSLIRAKHTIPEITVRSALRAHGLEYRLHRKDLPGKPDIILAPRKVAIFVHGCFWHRHRCKMGISIPSSNVRYWKAKFEANKIRDRRARKDLNALGWRVFTIWECQSRDPAKLAKIIRNKIGLRRSYRS